MSKLVIEVCQIDEISDHPNADKLAIAKIKGWNTVIGKDTFKVGDKVIWIPYDTCIEKDIAEKLGVYQYLKGKDHNRVGRINLRGQPSFGIVAPLFDPNWSVGKDVSVEYKCTKYEPPVNNSHTNQSKNSQAVKRHPLFPKYTDIDNLRHYPDAIPEGTEIVVTEKIHGTNFGLAYIDGRFYCTSRTVQRGEPGLDEQSYRSKVSLWMKFKRFFAKYRKQSIDIEKAKDNWWWRAYVDENVRNMLVDLGKEHKVVAVYGETFGDVQYLKYGVTGLDFRIFDIYIDGKYISYTKFADLQKQYNFPAVPVIYVGPYSLEKVAELSKGNTSINNANHIKEGVVVKPTTETIDPKFGRLIFKYINDAYLMDKKAEETDTTDN